MSAIRELLARLRGTAHRRRLDAEIDEEMRFHLEMHAEKGERAGMTSDDARRAALVAFGGRTRFADDVRDEARTRWLEDVAQDLRFAIRTLGRAPGFALVAIVSLALGIGANTAVFSVVRGVLLRPLPYPDADRLAVIAVRNDVTGHVGSVSVADFAALREGTESFVAIGAHLPVGAGVTLVRSDGPEQLTGTFITSEVLSVLGVPPLLGRGPIRGEDAVGGARVVVLSHRFWRERFGGSPDAVGRAITLDGDPYTVVGVMPPGFALPNLPDDDLWPVLQLEAPTARAPFWLQVIARRRAGAGVDASDVELSRLAASVKARWPASPPHWSYAMDDLKRRLVRDARTTILVLYGAVGLLLLLAAINVSNLVLVRAAARQSELAVRAALGASRARLTRQFVTESVLLAALGGAAGIALAYAGVAMLQHLPSTSVPRLREVTVDGGVLFVAAAVIAVTGILIGLVPAFLVRHARLARDMQGAGRGDIGGGRGRVRQALVVGEVALALTVVVGAGLVVNSLFRLQEVDAGVRHGNVLVARLSIPQARYADEDAVERFYDDAARRIAAIPGITSVAFSMAVPPHRLVMTNPYTPEGTVYGSGESAPLAEQLMVTPAYFETLGIPIARGRGFTDADRADAPRVMIINETLARRAFPGGDALGRWMQTGAPHPDAPRKEIVGIVPDVKYQGLDAPPEPTIYVPFKQSRWWRRMYLVARTSGDPLRHVPAVRTAVMAIDPQIALEETRALDELLSESVATPRHRAILLGTFAFIALLLAAAGIYGVISYGVTQRQREMGVRLALGATPGAVSRLVVRDGIRLAAIGIACGIALALAVTRLLSGILFGVGPRDPVTFGVTIGVLLLVALAASLIPAYRASRTDPLTTIRA